MSVFEAIPPPQRRLRRLWQVVRHGLPSTGRYHRYLRVVVPLLVAIWVLSIGYMLFWPKSYSSEFVLILPGAGSGSSLNVELIGQAQSAASSAFASPTLSPTENYKQLLTADVTLRAAAAIAHVPAAAFPAPRIKLVDTTNLIMVTISGKTAAGAHANAEALRSAFMAELDHLRADEAERREASDQRHLEDLANKVRDAQAKLTAFQIAHGMTTVEQFNARIGSIEGLHDKQRELRLLYDEQRGTSDRLIGILGNSPESANALMRLRGDPVFAELVHRYAVNNADAELKSGTLGPRHAALAANNAERDALLRALLARGHAIVHLSDDQLIRLADLELGEGRNTLMTVMSEGNAQAHGTARAIRDIAGDIRHVARMTPEWIALERQLADLQRDQRVTEAVFSSALARLETNRQDPFASYPLVQTLAAPSLPEKAASPSKAVGIAGGVVASLFALIACALAWLRAPILDRIARNRGEPGKTMSVADLQRLAEGASSRPRRKPRTPT